MYKNITMWLVYMRYTSNANVHVHVWSVLLFFEYRLVTNFSYEVPESLCHKAVSVQGWTIKLYSYSCPPLTCTLFALWHMLMIRGHGLQELKLRTAQLLNMRNDHFDSSCNLILLHRYICKSKQLYMFPMDLTSP